jgi:hypothetical protein
VENHQNNPLTKYFRQPKIYIRLPSSGMFYPEGSLEKTENGEYPVYAMTAKDEIVMRTPDALLNGQATVDVIQSCMPNIKNAWMIPSIDIDAILTAIRLATYGEKLDISVDIPVVNDRRTYELDLRMVLDKLLEAAYDSEVNITPDLTAFIRPLTYKEFTQNAIKTLEEQRVFAIVNDDSMSDEQKLDLFNKSFKKLTEINIGLVSQSISKITTPDGDVVDPTFIKEFIDNADKDFYKAILDHLELQKKRFSLEPFVITTTEEDQVKGAPKTVEVPITLDNANFFV